MGSLEFCAGLIALGFLIYYYLTSTYNYWKDRGVAGPKPVPGFGNILPVMFQKVSMGDLLYQIYTEYKKEPMVGIFVRRKPLLVLNDPELIKDVLIKDFSKFSDRGIPPAERGDPLSQTLFSLEPARWRPLRSKLSPVFTSGKLKDMFVMILECSEHFEKYVEKVATRGEPVEVRDLTAKFTTDVIGTCAFGIDTKAVGDEDSEFRRMGKQIFQPGTTRLLRFRLRQIAPWLYDLLSYIWTPTEVTTFFMKLTMDTLGYREKNNIVRNDFVNTLLEIKKNPDKIDIKLTDSLIASQAFVFFAAGFETSSTTMSNALYELALNQDIQDKLREEIRMMYVKNKGDLQYDAIKELKYLDCVFRETLRKYPPVTFLMRSAVDDYTFQGAKFSIPKGMRIWIPNYAIQRDPDIFPDPEKFIPERFSDENTDLRHPMTYLPFGDGPRNCIGARFAVYQTKVGLIKILRNYKVDVCEKTPIPYENEPRAFLLMPKGGIHLKITKLESS